MRALLCLAIALVACGSDKNTDEGSRKSSPGGTWPLGSIIVKDGFNGGGYDLTAVMEKREGGWYWAEYGNDGTPLFSGQPSVCTDCHESGADMVRAFGFP